MAIAKARSSQPVHGYEVTTIHTGRITQRSGAGFGLSRLGGLINARVEGLTGGTAASRLATPKPLHETVAHPEVAKLQDEITKKNEKVRLEQHKQFFEDRKVVYKEQAEDEQKAEEVQAELAKQQADKNQPTVKPVDIVDNRVTTKTSDATKLDDPKSVAEASKKTVEQQKAEVASTQGNEQQPAAEKPRADVRPEKNKEKK